MNKTLLCASLALGASATAQAADVQLVLNLPRLDVAEYHRPYVAVWVERAGAPAQSLALWYAVTKPNKGGETWLPDVRQWWRKAGRDLALPMDGVSAPTRGPGDHKLNLSKAISALPPGRVELVVEAAREGGGREIQRMALSLPITTAQSVSAEGEHELGQLLLRAKP